MLLTEVNEHRAQLSAVTALAVSDATGYARSIAGEAPELFAGQMREASESIVTTYSGVAAEGAAILYESQRPQPGAPVRIAAPSIGEKLTADLGWAFLPAFAPDGFPNPLGALLERIGGVVQKHVAAGDRQTMLLTAGADPLARGVRRYARPGACGFCAYLTSIDADVHEDTDWHRNCHCVTVPWWDDNPLPISEDATRWAKAANEARDELIRLQRELKPADMRRSNFFRMRPDLAVNTSNIVAIMRRDLGLAH